VFVTVALENVISPSDPSSAWMAKANKRVQFGYRCGTRLRLRPAPVWHLRIYWRPKPSSSLVAQASVVSMASPWEWRTIIFGMMAWVQI
jgi:hypothetical protein